MEYYENFNLSEFGHKKTNCKIYWHWVFRKFIIAQKDAIRIHCLKNYIIWFNFFCRSANIIKHIILSHLKKIYICFQTKFFFTLDSVIRLFLHCSDHFCIRNPGKYGFFWNFWKKNNHVDVDVISNPIYCNWVFASNSN